VAVAGVPDERWGQRITAFVKRSGVIEADMLDAWCRGSSPLDIVAAPICCRGSGTGDVDRAPRGGV